MRANEADLESRLMVLATAVLFSTGGAVIKATTFSGWQVASFRCGIAALASLILLPSSRRGWSYKTWMVGGVYAAALISYAVANKLTTAASTIFLYSITPLYILFLGPLILKEPFRRRDLVFMVALATGFGLVFTDSQGVYATAPAPFKGNLVAAFGGFCFALVVMGLRWLSRSDPPGRSSSLSALVAGNLIAFWIALPLALPVSSSTPLDWSLVIYLGVIQIALAYFLLTKALRRIPALEASLLLLAEPVLNPTWAWIFHGERPGPKTLAGGAVILIATAGLTLISTWTARQIDQSSDSTGQ